MAPEYSDTLTQSAGNGCLVNHEVIGDSLHRILHREMSAQKISVKQLALDSGVPERHIRAYRENQAHDRRPSHTCYAFSLVLALGPRAVMSFISETLDYSAKPNGEEPIEETARKIRDLADQLLGSGSV